MASKMMGRRGRGGEYGASKRERERETGSKKSSTLASLAPLFSLSSFFLPKHRRLQPFCLFCIPNPPAGPPTGPFSARFPTTDERQLVFFGRRHVCTEGKRSLRARETARPSTDETFFLFGLPSRRTTTHVSSPIPRTKRLALPSLPLSRCPTRASRTLASACPTG